LNLRSQSTLTRKVDSSPHRHRRRASNLSWLAYYE